MSNLRATPSAEQWLRERFPICDQSPTFRVRMQPEGWDGNHEHFAFISKDGKSWTIAEMCEAYAAYRTTAIEVSPISICPRCEGTGLYSRLPTVKDCAICEGTGRIGPDGTAFRSSRATTPVPLPEPPEPDFCVCDYRPRRKCSVHPESNNASQVEAIFQEVEEELLSGELSETWPEIREWISSKLNAISPRPLHAEVLDALKKMVEFGEEVERQNLVGYEGCFWPVEIARDVIRRASSQVPFSAPPTPWPGSNPNKANPPTSGEIARSAHPNRVSEWISVEETPDVPCPTCGHRARWPISGITE